MFVSFQRWRRNSKHSFCWGVLIEWFVYGYPGSLDEENGNLSHGDGAESAIRHDSQITLVIYVDDCGRLVLFS
jgi:hypothetical protein